MSSCSIKWCGKNSKTSHYSTDGITFHRFPKDPDRKALWISAANRDNWFPATFSVVCSRHFTSDCFEQIKGSRRRLFSSAVPTLLLPKLVSHEENTKSDDEERSISAVNEASTDEHSQAEVNNIDISSSTSKKILCRKIIDLNKKLKETKLVVKRLKDSNRFLKSKVNTSRRLIEKLKNKELITKEFIDIDRLQNSNKQLRKKVIWLKKLLDEQKKKNLLNRQNVVWCPAPEQQLNAEETLAIDKE